MRLVELGPSFNGPKNIKGECTLQDLNRVPQVRGGEREGLSQAMQSTGKIPSVVLGDDIGLLR